MIPKTKAEATGTHFAHLWETPNGWPPNVRRLTLDDEGLGIDPVADELYWNGRPLQVRRSVTLEGWGLGVAIVATVATLIAAVWPIVDYFWLP